MFKEKGQIVDIKEGKAEIRLTPGEHCHHCGAQTVCSSLGPSARIIRVKVNSTFNRGDWVELSFESSTRIISAVLVFLLPIILMVIGLAFAVIRYGDSEKVAILGSLSGLVGGFAIVGIINKLLAKRATWDPIVRKV